MKTRASVYNIVHCAFAFAIHSYAVIHGPPPTRRLSVGSSLRLRVLLPEVLAMLAASRPGPPHMLLLVSALCSSLEQLVISLIMV